MSKKYIFIVLLSLFLLQACNEDNTSAVKSFQNNNKTGIDNNIIQNQKINSTLAVLVDSETYQGAAAEIGQFVEDLRKDTNLNVNLKIFPINSEREAIKEHIKKLYFENHLEVVILIGDIPTAYYFPGSVSQEKIPTDFYYYDVFDKCPFNKETQAFDSRNRFCSPVALPFIISRITSPEEGGQGIELIKNYLNNNHAFRTSQINFDQKALVYPQLLNDIPKESRQSTFENIMGNFKVFFAINALPIYGENEVIVSQWESTNSNPSPNSEFLQELSKSHQYIFIDAHGSPTGHLYRIANNNLKNPSAFYVDFYSCNVGKFTEEGYIAGYYLMNGKTMFVKASSDFLFKPIGMVESQKLFLLKQGLPILDTIRTTDSFFIIQYFGDPTLSMPQGEIQKSSKARIYTDKKELDFGEIKVCDKPVRYSDCSDPAGVSKVSLGISNIGEDSLGFFVSVASDFSFGLIKNSHPSEGFDKPYQVTFDDISYEISRGQKSQFAINMLGLAEGDYSGNLIIYNSDPTKPLLKVPYKVKIIS